MPPAASSRPASPTSPPSSEGWRRSASCILTAARSGGRITIHGDYDVDGVSSTAILVSTLRSLGASCDWLIPDRLADGYGLTMSSVEELQRRGTGPRHHGRLRDRLGRGGRGGPRGRASRSSSPTTTCPGEQLPDCPIDPPDRLRLPLRGALRRRRRAQARRSPSATRRGGERSRPSAAAATPATANLDLVALATVADMVPLVGENRRLVREGLRVMRDGPRVGPAGADGRRRRRPADRRRRCARLPPRPPHQRSGPPLPGGRRRGADAHRRSRPRRRDRRRARPGQRRAPLGRAEGGGGGGARPLRPPARAGRRPRPGPRAARDGIPASSASPPRGWWSATSGRPSCSRSTATSQGLGPQHPRLRPGRRPRRHLRASRPLRRPPRRGGPRAGGRSSRRLPGGVHRPCGGRASTPPTWSGTDRLDALVGVGRDGHRHGPRAPARDPRPVRYGQSRARACSSPPVACARSAPSARRASTRASSSRAGPAARSASPSA